MPLWDFSNSQFDNNRSINKNTYFIDITETYQRCETRSLLFRLIQWHFIANNTWNLKIFMSSFLFLPFFTHIFLSIYLSTLAVRVKQEHRNDLDSPAVSPMSMPLVHAASLVCAQPLSSPEHSHPPDGLLSSSPRGLAAGLHPLQAPCAPMGSPTLPHLPHLQAQGLNAPPECQMPFHPGHAATARPSYPHIQHNMPFNGQHSLPMTVGSPQAYERMPFQADPAGCHSLGLGMVYGPASLTPTSGVPPGPGSIPCHAACTGSNQVMVHSAPHLHSLGYHCPTPGQVPSPTHTMGQPAPQLQHPLIYHPTGQRSASCPTPSSAPAHMVPSPHSGPSSPQLHSLPYHSPTSPSPTSNSPLGPMALSGQPSPQASSPVLAGLSPTGPLVHPLTQQGERLNIKQEPEDREPTFRTIGLQDITLDDGESLHFKLFFFCLMTLESDHCNMQFGVWGKI